MASEPTAQNQPQNTTQTDWRIIGVSGDTIDGREISAEQLTQMAQDYNPKVYGARINIEHYWWDDMDTGGLGDVIELKTEAWEQDPSKTALLAKFSVYPAMQKLWNEGRKIYTSMEIHHNFANTKRAYLTGLAITDTPASLGTTANFSYAQQHSHNKGKTFSEYREFSHNQATDSPPTPITESPSMNTNTEPQPTPAPTQTAPAPDTAGQPEKHASASTPTAPTIAQLQTQISALQTELTELKTQLNTQAHTGNRPPHTGNDAPTPVIW
ncbi:GPO family capsid scaffolding protein [Kingella sp. (in: b-proteobacteria)]|uniref:GPO family capsid scaffolding protein n=1 Tax=Kingella sp. (in: b-proteobacteria) TaxID=2020713 RepID=UPI0026DB2E13|nr:GPO family capsid scaffolding protein [Kingella sp. (in: b-proteobacteria)]MDO4658328.1 GPO family capsid scaffolding protein [Kingella sp. (in: b-proteobacteria)]